jgi:hypothetical protein
MYQVSNAFHERSYSGSSNYKSILTVGSTIVPASQIASITIDYPIIDIKSQTFYVGTFIANTLKIKFKSLTGLTIESGVEVRLEIGQYIDDTDPSYQYTNEQHALGYVDGYEYVPMGYFLIDELKENYQETCEIDCIDYSAKFKQAVDYSGCFDENGTATIDTILQQICTMCGVTLDSNFPTTNGDTLIGTFDGSVSGKQWISYIAEIKGCNAKMGRDGILYLIPLKQTPSVSINALRGKSWKLGERYSLQQIKFYNGGRWLESTNSNPNYDNILYIRPDNPFVDDTSQTFIDNIYDVLEDLVIYNVECENRADISLDAWDNLTYTLHEDSYQTLNHSTYTYQVAISTKVNNKIPTKNEEQTTNVIKEDALTYAKSVKVTVDNIEGSIRTLTRQVENIGTDFVRTSEFEQYQHDAELEFASKVELTDGSVTKAVSTNFTFDQDGITTTASESETNIQLGFQRENDEIVKEGMSVKTKSGKEILFAGYDKNVGVDGETIVRVDNMTTNHYQVAQYNDQDVWRREIIYDSTYGLGYAFFYVGDDN